MNIKYIIYDWQDDQYQYRHEIGVKGVTEIVSHFAQGEGDKCYWTVTFEDGHEEQIFNINRVYLIPR